MEFDVSKEEITKKHMMHLCYRKYICCIHLECWYVGSWTMNLCAHHFDTQTHSQVSGDSYAHCQQNEFGRQSDKDMHVLDTNVQNTIYVIRCICRIYIQLYITK